MSTPYKKEKELIDEVLKEFNFDNCKLIMEYLHWTWGFNNVSPSINELKESARERIENAIDGIKKSKDHSYHSPYSSSSGGLKATVYKNRYGRIVNLELEFVLEDWNSES